VTTPSYTPQINGADHEEFEFRDFLRLLRRRGWIVLLCVLAIPVAAYFYTAGRPKVFQATTIIEPQSTSSSALPPDFQQSQPNVQAIAGFVNTSAVANEAARQLKLPPGSLGGAASATANTDTNFITISAVAPTAKEAADRANAFAAALDATQNKTDKEQIARAISTLQQNLANTSRRDPNRLTMQSQLQSLQTLQRAQSQNVRVLQPALGAAQIAPHPKRNATLAILLGLLVGVGLVLVAERFDRRLRKPEDLEQIPDLPFLGTIPQAAFEKSHKNQDVAEAFQTLRNSLSFLNVDEPFRTLAVTSGLKGEGKTTVALHLALAYASFGKRVIVIDTDLRKPDLATRLGVPDSPGLTDVLGGDISPWEAMRDVSDHGSLRLLAAGQVPPDPSALLGSQRMASLIPELAADADVLILDTTPLLIVSDAFPLLDKVSGVVAVTRLNQTPKDAIRRMLQIAASAGARVAGVVVTGARSGALTGYGYGYGYGAGYGRDGGTAADDVALEPRR
jgi:capsular exopolysaccharide synthesis family protein